jgi:hypothetical protein
MHQPQMTAFARMCAHIPIPRICVSPYAVPLYPTGPHSYPPSVSVEWLATAILDPVARRNSSLFDGSLFVVPLTFLDGIDLSDLSDPELLAVTDARAAMQEGDDIPPIVLVLAPGSSVPVLTAASAAIRATSRVLLAAYRARGASVAYVGFWFPEYVDAYAVTARLQERERRLRAGDA